MREPRWLLGFDGGCPSCTKVAGRVEELSSGKVSARSLREHEVHHWLSDSLGEGARWAPTLFELTDTRVRAWQGWRMGWRLSRLLGPARTWHVLRALVDANDDDGAAAALSGRRRFLRNLSGAILAASVLSGATALTSLAAAADGNKRKVLALETAGEGTRVDMLGRARTDRRVRQLGDYLSNSGYVAEGDSVFAARQDGQTLRTVAARKFTSATSGSTAYVALGIEASGQTWVGGVVSQNGHVSSTLGLSANGAVTTTPVPQAAPQTELHPLDPVSCFICQALVQGACGVDCGLACLIVCGGPEDVPCLVVCGGICIVACVIGFTVEDCFNYGYCP